LERRCKVFYVTNFTTSLLCAMNPTTSYNFLCQYYLNDVRSVPRCLLVQRHPPPHNIKFVLSIHRRPAACLARGMSPPLALSNLGPHSLVAQAFAKVVHDDTGPDE
jgi:hypothetical protein